MLIIITCNSLPSFVHIPFIKLVWMLSLDAILTCSFTLVWGPTWGRQEGSEERTRGRTREEERTRGRTREEERTRERTREEETIDIHAC